MSTMISDSDIALIRAAYADRNKLPDARAAVERALEALDCGAIRVAEQSQPGDWHVNAWVKEAILCFFRLSDVSDIEAGDLRFRDLMPTKTRLASAGIRVVPPAVARYGSFLEPGVIMMPSFVKQCVR